MYAGVYAEIISDDSLVEIGIILHYRPVKGGGGFSDSISPLSHDEMELLKQFIPHYVSWDNKPRLLLDSNIKDIKIDEEIKPTARGLAERLKRQVRYAQLGGMESNIITRLWLDLARDIENQSKSQDKEN